MSTEDYCLRWEEGKQLSSVGPWSSSIDDLKNNEAFWDIKLVTEESEIKCHKFILGKGFLRMMRCSYVKIENCI